MNNMLKISLVAAFFLLIIGLIFGLLMFNKKRPDYGSMKADHVVTVEKLFRDYKNDQLYSNKYYAGKIVQVSGVMTSFEDMDSVCVAVFALEEGMFGDEGVRCSIKSDHFIKARKLKKGQQVKIQGLCSGFNDPDVLLEECAIIP